MATLLSLFRLNDNRIAISGIRDPDGVYLEGGSTSVSLEHEADDTPVAGQAWPLVLAWDAVGKRFTGQIDAEVDVALGETVRVYLWHTTAGGAKFYDEQYATVRLPTIP